MAHRDHFLVLGIWLLLVAVFGDAVSADPSKPSRTSMPPMPRISQDAGHSISGILGDDVDANAASDTDGPRLCRNVDGADSFRPPQCPRPVDSHKADAVAPASWWPWTYLPECSDDNIANATYCVFTHAYYGGGISIIATPEAAASIASTVAAGAPQSPLASSSPAIRVQPLPGKGLGIVARTAIPRGTVLMRDHARVLAATQFPLHMRRDTAHALLYEAAHRLPVPGDMLHLSRAVPGRPDEARGVGEESVLSTNSFAVTVEGATYMGLFPKIARINHACKPTAITRFHESDLTQSVIAFRDIAPGEEITVSYVDFGLAHNERQQALRRRWGFACTCDLCSGGTAAAAASDARRRRVTAVRDEVVAHIRAGAVAAAIAAYEDELLGLVRAEGLAEHMGEHYEVLARLHLAAGNRTAAGRYAQQALAELEAFDDGTARARRELRAFVTALERVS